MVQGLFPFSCNNSRENPDESKVLQVMWKRLGKAVIYPIISAVFRSAAILSTHRLPHKPICTLFSVQLHYRYL